jgi:hypothetical protein
MNPGLGRFWTMDSYEGAQGDPLSLQKYLYCHANPVNGIDPSGRLTLTENQAVGIVTALLAAATLQSINIAKHTATRRIDTARYYHGVSTTMAVAEEADYVRPKTKAETRERIRRKIEKDGGVQVFLHGTSSGAFKDFASGKVDFTLGSGDFGQGFYTTRAPEGMIAAGGYAYQKESEHGGFPLVLIFVIKNKDMPTLRSLPMRPNPAAYMARFPGFDFVEGPMGLSYQYKWEIGSRGSALLLNGFRGFVPLPEMTPQNWRSPE